jgi:hypothetical protein
MTFDSYKVRFRKSIFEHAFYESTHRDKIKDMFSTKRAERMDWIKYALQDPNSDIRNGYDNKRKRFTINRRVTIISGNYIVIIRIKSRQLKEAEFITAYVADSQTTSQKILTSPKWEG